MKAYLIELVLLFVAAAIIAAITAYLAATAALNAIPA